MKFTIYAMLLAIALTGCASTTNDNKTSNTSAKETEINISETEPTISLTVVAQKLKEWPYEKSKLTYKLQNQNFTTEDQKVEGANDWQKIVEESIVDKLSGLGLTRNDNKPRLVITYGLTAASSNDKASNAMFNSIGLTTGSTTRGSNAAIDVTIRDIKSNVTLWTGAVSATADRPIATKQQKERTVNSLIDSLLDKLPVAQ